MSTRRRGEDVVLHYRLIGKQAKKQLLIPLLEQQPTGKGLELLELAGVQIPPLEQRE